MLPTLIKALKTDNLLAVVSAMSLAPIDIDLILYDAQQEGIVEVDKEKGKIKLIEQDEVQFTYYFNAELLEKIKAIIGHYDRQEANITYNRLFEIVCNLSHPSEKYGYLKHDFICTMYYLENTSDVKSYDIKVEEIKDKRPYQEFKFYTFLDHQEFGARAVNDFIDQFNDKKVK